MLRRLATMIGYAKKPKLTYVVKHPRKGLMAYAAAKGLRYSATARRTLFGVGALALAVPAGVWLANRNNEPR